MTNVEITLQTSSKYTLRFINALCGYVVMGPSSAVGHPQPSCVCLPQRLNKNYNLIALVSYKKTTSEQQITQSPSYGRAQWYNRLSGIIGKEIFCDW